MKTPSKILAILLCVALLFVMTACTSSTDLVGEVESPTLEQGDETTEDKYNYVETITKRKDDKSQLPAGTGRTIAMITPVMGMTFSLMIGTGASDAVREGDTFQIYSYEWDVDTFMDQMESLVVQGVDGVIILSNETEVATTVARVGEDAGIPVVIVENGISDPSVVHATVSGDNYGMGWNIGQALAEGFYKDKGNYDAKILTYFPLNTGIAQTRYQGFLDAIAEYEGMEVVYNIEGDASSDLALPLIESALSAHPEVNAFSCSFDPAAIAAVQAFNDAGRDDITIVTNECTLWVSEQIRDGVIYAGIDTGPYTTGYNGTCVLYDILDGKEYHDQYYILPVTYTIDNLDDCATWQIQQTVESNSDLQFLT